LLGGYIHANHIGVSIHNSAVMAWLTEQYDRAERKEGWTLVMEAAVTVLVAAELFFSITNFIHNKH